jgi:hypothetical protein
MDDRTFIHTSTGERVQICTHFTALTERFVGGVFTAVGYQPGDQPLVGVGSMFFGDGGTELCMWLSRVVSDAGGRSLIVPGEFFLEFMSFDMNRAFYAVCHRIIRDSDELSTRYATNLGMDPLSELTTRQAIATRMADTYANEAFIHTFTKEFAYMGLDNAKFETFKFVLGPAKQGGVCSMWKELGPDILMLICSFAIKRDELEREVTNAMLRVLLGN